MPQLEPGTQVGSYVVEEVLGSGGMATVYRVRHSVLGSLHALKVLVPDLLVHADIRQRFLDEGQIQARIRHGNIVAVTDLVSEPGVAGLVMEYVEGTTLEALLEQHGPLDEAEAVYVMEGILSGAAAAHESGVIHRDLKPANILIATDADGMRIPKILDFGVAKVTDGDRKGKTRTGARMGTVAYMSPEQVRGAANVDRRSDIWSLGVILYELLTGRTPFEGADDFETMQRIDGVTMTPLAELRPELSPAIVQAVHTALRRSPEQRFDDCSSFAQALSDASITEPVARAPSLERDDAATGAGLEGEPPFEETALPIVEESAPPWLPVAYRPWMAGLITTIAAFAVTTHFSKSPAKLQELPLATAGLLVLATIVSQVILWSLDAEHKRNRTDHLAVDRFWHTQFVFTGALLGLSLGPLLALPGGAGPGAVAGGAFGAALLLVPASVQITSLGRRVNTTPLHILGLVVTVVFGLVVLASVERLPLAQVGDMLSMPYLKREALLRIGLPLMLYVALVVAYFVACIRVVQRPLAERRPHLSSAVRAASTIALLGPVGALLSFLSIVSEVKSDAVGPLVLIHGALIVLTGSWWARLRGLAAELLVERAADRAAERAVSAPPAVDDPPGRYRTLTTLLAVAGLITAAMPVVGRPSAVAMPLVAVVVLFVLRWSAAERHRASAAAEGLAEVPPIEPEGLGRIAAPALVAAAGLLFGRLEWEPVGGARGTVLNGVALGLPLLLIAGWHSGRWSPMRRDTTRGPMPEILGAVAGLAGLVAGHRSMGASGDTTFAVLTGMAVWAVATALQRPGKSARIAAFGGLLVGVPIAYGLGMVWPMEPVELRLIVDSEQVAIAMDERCLTDGAVPNCAPLRALELVTKVAPGPHRFVFTRHRHQPAEVSYLVRGGPGWGSEVAPEEVRGAPLPNFGLGEVRTFIGKTEITGVPMLLDSQAVGTSPVLGLPIDPGPRQLQVDQPCWSTTPMTAQVDVGKAAQLEFQLEPRPLSTQDSGADAHLEAFDCLVPKKLREGIDTGGAAAKLDPQQQAIVAAAREAFARVCKGDAVGFPEKPAGLSASRLAACDHLATLQAAGLGGSVDLGVAFKLRNLACNGGIATACTGLGLQLWRGSGTKRNSARAAAVLTQGCQLGDPMACGIVGAARFDGLAGFRGDASRGLTMMEEACGAGQGLACVQRSLRLALGTPPKFGPKGPGGPGYVPGLDGDPSMAFGEAAAACDRQIGLACRLAGIWLSLGEGVMTDHESARARFRSGCSADDPRSCALVSSAGESYAMGKALDQLRSEARPLSVTCPPGMAYISGAEFELSDPSGGRGRKVAVSGFCMAKTEVTMREFFGEENLPEMAPPPPPPPISDESPVGFGAEGDGAMGEEAPAEAAAPPPVVDVGALPAANVTREAARDYCRTRGLRLPTDAEWELAARGVPGRSYPWGAAAPKCSLAQFAGCGDTPRPAGGGRSRDGLLDLAGNVAEWVEDCGGAGAYGPAWNPGTAENGCSPAVVRGGSFLSEPSALRGSQREFVDQWSQASTIGFRCVRSVP